MKNKIGLIGATGRMGILLSPLISSSAHYELGCSFDTNNPNLKDVFNYNDYVVDFSSNHLTEQLLTAAISTPKPTLICTTGWHNPRNEALLNELSLLTPVFISSNTSLGAYLQYYIARQLSKFLDSEYDIEVIEKHHRNKVDIPSGTAHTLISGIQEVKSQQYSLNYSSMQLSSGPRPENIISFAVSRSGNLHGEHEVIFTSNEESIAVKHTAFDRKLFAKGAIKILDWLRITQPAPGIYGMTDLLHLA